MEEWNGYFNEGMSYYNTTIGGIKKGRKFGNVVYYNLIGIALECFLTAALVKEGQLPEHSSISSIIRELKKRYEVPESFTEDSRFYNKFWNFCSLEIVKPLVPSDEEIQRLVTFVENVKVWTEALLEEPVKAV
ncbi:hypothetical protein [Mangrovibacterium sp.]|uniref:hypothetical protein n=1 Tax=Mangrovibacterium sp. TaxID=1961364 RepID=UPI0035654AC3